MKPGRASRGTEWIVAHATSQTFCHRSNVVVYEKEEEEEEERMVFWYCYGRKVTTNINKKAQLKNERGEKSAIKTMNKKQGKT